MTRVVHAIVGGGLGGRDPLHINFKQRAELRSQAAELRLQGVHTLLHLWVVEGVEVVVALPLGAWVLLLMLPRGDRTLACSDGHA